MEWCGSHLRWSLELLLLAGLRFRILAVDKTLSRRLRSLHCAAQC